jgi:hypothetical protein
MGAVRHPQFERLESHRPPELQLDAFRNVVFAFVVSRAKGARDTRWVYRKRGMKRIA